MVIMHFQCAYKFRAMSWSINNVMSDLYYYLFYILNSGELVPIPVTLLALNELLLMMMVISVFDFLCIMCDFENLNRSSVFAG